MLWLVVVLAVVGFWWVLVPLFERFAPPAAVRAYQRLTNTFLRPMAGWVPGFALVETTGRRTGLRRRTPVGGRRQNDTFWFVAGIGRRTRYVRNIEANPRVRVKRLGRWHAGTARLCPEDDWRRRMFRVNPTNGLFLWIAGGEGMTVRVDLDGGDR
ncbi:MAG: nitroreductase/quinone reductase family protein [Candidatus Binatia bacterium]